MPGALPELETNEAMSLAEALFLISAGRRASVMT
jgi:hypothetical protein